MALHFTADEFAERRQRTLEAMNKRGLDALLMFKQESMYWLTGYDTFGFCFFQCLILRADGEIVLLTRAPDLRQAQNTSIIEDIRIWVDRDGATPADDLKGLLRRGGLEGKRLGIEYDSNRPNRRPRQAGGRGAGRFCDGDRLLGPRLSAPSDQIRR